MQGEGDNAKDRAWGLAYGGLAYAWWGLSPLFWKELGAVHAVDTIGWRVFSTFLLLTVVVGARRGFAGVFQIATRRSSLIASFVTALLIAINWGVYVWAVAESRVTEASLGYFMNPLVTVLLAVVVLKESLRRFQWLAVGMAACGVAWLTLSLGTLPWVSLALAGSFALYGLLRKTMRAGPLAGLTFEMLLLLLPGVLLLNARGEFQEVLVYDAKTLLFLALSGAMTAIPLLMFAAAARAVPLTVLGLLQYFAPTFQFLLGVFYYGEPFGWNQLYGYGLVWLGLLVFVAEGIASRRGSLKPTR